jgi:hypothetical protein
MSADCLVLHLGETDMYTGVFRTDIYVFNDSNTGLFEIRGKIQKPNKHPYNFSFQSETEDKLAEFLKYIMVCEDKMNEYLYNCKILPEETKDITYEFFDENIDKCQVIASKSFQKITTKRLTKLVKMVANVFNYY